MRLHDLSRDELPPTLTAVETAELLGVHVETLRALVRQGRAPVTALHVGRALRFPTARVLAVLGIDSAPAPNREERPPAEASVPEESSPLINHNRGRRSDDNRRL